MAGNIVVGSDLLKYGLGFLALIAGDRASAGEVAALGSIDGAGNITCEDLALLLSFLIRIRDRNSGEESF